MIAASFHVKLTLQGPVLTHSTSQGRYGVDAAMAKSGGHFYLPGTLVKGLIGEAWQELGCVDPAYATLRQTWFGGESRVQNLPLRGTMYFEDLRDPKPASEGTETQYRIQIDAERGSVKQGAYLVMEAPYRPGEKVVFEGTLWVLGESRLTAENARKDVQTALHWVSSAGAERSIGFGRVLSAECGPLQCLEWKAAVRPAPIKALDLELRFTRPVCFAKRRVAANLFESEPWLTGGALKGAVATLLAMDKECWPNLREHLHAIRFTHAFPSRAQDRPVFPPESLVKANGKTYDAVFEKDARADGDAPTFRVDWKDEGDVWKTFGWPELETELRVRTAIEGETKRAQDKQLFAYRMMVPKEGDVWKGSVILDGVDEGARAEVAAELDAALEHGLFALGKTKARATVNTKRAEPRTVKLRNGKVAITLQTAALLCDPSRHLAPNDGIGTAKLDAMQAEYKDVWNDLSGGALELDHFFHRISLAGSGYMRHRFQGGEPYRPYLLTDPGSVFLLNIKDEEKAQACVTRWLNRGIEVTKAVRRFYGLEGVPEQQLWMQCPYLPENGFGEIEVDVHETARVEVLGV